MRALLFVLLASAAAFAQGAGTNRPIFDLPDPAERPEKEQPPEEANEADALTRTIRRLAGWPGDSARRAAERLVVQKEKSKGPLFEILVSEDPKLASLKPGCAYVLGRIGDREHYLALLLAAAEKDQQRHGDVFLEAAWRLNPEETVREAFRFFRLQESTLRAEAARFVSERIGKANLPQVLDLLEARREPPPYTRVIALSLLDRLVRRGEVAWEEAGPRFYEALGDESPQVAREAMLLLASRDAPENVAALNALITQDASYWRQRSYAALALSILGGAFRIEVLEPETVTALRGPRGMQHPKEMLPRAAAALALAQAALRTGDPELARLLDREIPITLIEAVGASSRHYRDFVSVMPLAYTMLRRITGQNFADHAPVWADWWRDNGRRFRARRELIEVAPEDVPDASIDLLAAEDGARDGLRLVVAGPQPPSYRWGAAYALPKHEMAAILDALAQEGFFTTPECDAAAPPAGARALVVRVGDLSRTVAVPEDGPSLSRVQDAARRYAWQRWWDIDRQPTWALFFAENAKWFAEHAEGAERDARLRSLVAGSLNDLIRPEDRLAAVEELRALPGGAAALGETELRDVLDAIAREREPGPFVAACVDLLVPDAGETVALEIVDLLAAKVGPAAHDLLVAACRPLGTARLRALCGDERWKVRRAAVVAIAEIAPEESRDILLGRLEDPETLVRAAAAEALARRGDPAILPALGGMARDESGEVRAAAAYLYGLLGTGEARARLAGLLYTDPIPEVRVRAIDGLAESASPGAADLLLGVFEKEGDLRVRAAAASALVRLETPELVERLVERLGLTPAQSPERVALVNVLARMEGADPASRARLDDALRAVLAGDDTASADAAALGLARRWDDTAFAQLVRMVQRRRNALTAVRHLQMLTSRAFDEEDYDKQAENYQAWALTSAAGTPPTWFSEALAEAGYDTAPLAPWLEGGALPDEAVPLLLRVLRDDAWQLRHNASRVLSARIGKGAPEPISYDSKPEEREAALRAYQDWWAERQAFLKSMERG